MKLDDLYHSMIEAANQALRASNDYVERETVLKDLVLDVCSQKGIQLDSPEYQTVEDDYLDNDKSLQKAFGRWDFWQREQRRRSDLIRTHIAYCQFYGKLPWATRPAAVRDSVQATASDSMQAAADYAGLR